MPSQTKTHVMLVLMAGPQNGRELMKALEAGGLRGKSRKTLKIALRGLVAEGSVEFDEAPEEQRVYQLTELGMAELIYRAGLGSLVLPPGMQFSTGFPARLADHSLSYLSRPS